MGKKSAARLRSEARRAKKRSIPDANIPIMDAGDVIRGKYQYTDNDFVNRHNTTPHASLSDKRFSDLHNCHESDEEVKSFKKVWVERKNWTPPRRLQAKRETHWITRRKSTIEVSGQPHPTLEKQLKRHGHLLPVDVTTSLSEFRKIISSNS